MRTSCTTEDEFIALYQRDCDDVSIFASTDKQLTEGAEVAFSLELANGQPMLRGLGVVVSWWATAQNRFGRAGAHIALVQLTSASEPILDRLLEMRMLTTAQPRQRTGNTQIRFGIVPSPTALAKWVDEESVVGDVRRAITGELDAVEPSTGTPATIVDDRASHTNRYEGPLRAPALPMAALAEPVPLAARVTAESLGLEPMAESSQTAAEPATTPRHATSDPMTTHSQVAGEPMTPPPPQQFGAAPSVTATAEAFAPPPIAQSIAPSPGLPLPPPMVARGSQPSALFERAESSIPVTARGSRPSTPALARGSQPAVEPTIVLPIPAPPRTQDSIIPYPSDAYRAVANRLAPGYRAIAKRLSPSYRAVASRVRPRLSWLSTRIAGAAQRVARWLAPILRAMWTSRARTPVVFAAGILVGVFVSIALRSTPGPATAASLAQTEPAGLPIAAATPCTVAEPAVAVAPPLPTDIAAAPPAKPIATKKKPITKRPGTIAATMKPAIAKPAAATKPALATKPAAPTAGRSVATNPRAPTAAATKRAAPTKTMGPAPAKPATIAKPPVVTTTATGKPGVVAPAATKKPAVTKPTAPKKPARKPACEGLDCV